MFCVHQLLVLSGKNNTVTRIASALLLNKRGSSSSTVAVLDAGKQTVMQLFLAL